jgi:uncharacterized coiled-coil DUF342 family protein
MEAGSDNKRLDRLEAWQEIFQARLEKVEELCEKISDVGSGLGLLRQGLEDYKELADERLDNIKAMFEQVNGSVEKTDKNVGKISNRLLWFFGSIGLLLIAAIAAFLLKG